MKRGGAALSSIFLLLSGWIYLALRTARARATSPVHVRERAPSPGPAGIGPNDSSRALPASFRDLYLGMALTDFEAARPDPARRRDSSMDFRIEIEERPGKDDIDKVVWYFDTDLPGQPLYEGVFDFRPGFDAAGYARERYGPANSEGEWERDSGAGFPIRIWAFGSTLAVAAILKGTEWAK